MSGPGGEPGASGPDRPPTRVTCASVNHAAAPVAATSSGENQLSSSGRRTTPAVSIGIGMIAAIVGAVLWAVIVDVTDYKVGYAAVGLGLLIGLAMARTAPAWRPLPFVAAVIALAGCLLGDFFVDATAVGQLTGQGTLSALTDMITDPGLGSEVFSAGFEGMDALFWIIAAIAAFRLTSGAVARLAAAPASPADVAPSLAPTGPSDLTSTVFGQPATWTTPQGGIEPQHPAAQPQPTTQE
jgi:hypothetical protein